jgi:hypothetical protein
LSRNGVLSEAKAGGAHLVDRMRENLKRFGGWQGTGRTRLVLSLDEKASPYTLKGQGILRWGTRRTPAARHNTAEGECLHHHSKRIVLQVIASSSCMATAARFHKGAAAVTVQVDNRPCQATLWTLGGLLIFL